MFENGIDIPDYWETQRVTYNFYGRQEEIEFLKRLYDLENMPSLDSRFSDAESDIWQHTVNNDDYSPCWVFEDERFQLKNGSDEVYLKFICEIFHPAVREEKGYWKEFLEEINRLLKNDGYELYPAEKISNRDVYGWRIYSPMEESYLFLILNAIKVDKGKKIKLSIRRRARGQIYQLLKTIIMFIKKEMKLAGIMLLQQSKKFLRISGSFIPLNVTMNKINMLKLITYKNLYITALHFV